MLDRVRQFAVTAIIIGLLAPGAVTGAQGPNPGEGPWLQYAMPRLGGFNADKLEAARQRAEEMGSGAVLVVRNGIVVAAWGDIERKFKCHSVRKSFLSALYGDAVARGDIDLNATMAGLGIDDVHELTEREKGATVKHLLQARSGVYHPAAKEPRSMKEGRPERGSAVPGESFWYNNWDFNTAGRVFEQATGTGIFEAFEKRLARPLGMEDYRTGDGHYQYERKSSRVPAYAFRLSARDAARFGLLYLRDGNWNGRQLVPADWIEASWKPHSDLGSGRGYGYMWWTYGPGTLPAHPDLSAYAASGTGGQLIAVLPDVDLVVVHRADTDFSRGVDSREVWALVSDIVGAIDGKARMSRHLKEVAVQPFKTSLPPLAFPEIVQVSPGTLDRYVGRYLVDGESEVEIARLEGFLVGWMAGLGESDFFPVSDTEFWSRSAGATLKFDVGEGGGVSRATLRMRGREMVALPVAVAPAAATVEAGKSGH